MGPAALLCHLLFVASAHAALVLRSEPLLARRSAVLGAAAAATAWRVLPAVATTSSPSWTLPGGVKMPTLALNTAGLSADGSALALAEAARAGITHVDFHPGKERDGVARALKSLERSALFLTTKIEKPPAGISPADAQRLVLSQYDEDLGVLGVSQVDMLMLRDSPGETELQPP